MKNREKELKVSVIISLATLLFILAGVILELVHTGRLDSTGCMLLACSTTIYSSYELAYQKYRKAAQANQ